MKIASAGHGPEQLYAGCQLVLIHFCLKYQERVRRPAGWKCFQPKAGHEADLSGGKLASAG
jgi:hypothetical protein